MCHYSHADCTKISTKFKNYVNNLDVIQSTIYNDYKCIAICTKDCEIDYIEKTDCEKGWNDMRKTTRKKDIKTRTVVSKVTKPEEAKVEENTETKATAAKAAEEKKVEVKEPVAADAANKTEAKEDTVKTAKTTAAKPAATTAKTEEKKETVKAEPKAKTTRTAAKTVKAAETKTDETKAEPAKPKKTAKKIDASIFVQYHDLEAPVSDVVARVKDLFKQSGRKESEIKSLKVYIKPEERAAYYVINESETGKVNL